MAKKLLIDAKQPEETRVVLLNGNRIEDFDQETTTKLQNKGNIYLARVTRVEPSLQAAFVEYGGTRHGFLAFSEIHPDYYRIPVEDRKALTEEMLNAEDTSLDEVQNSQIDKDSEDTKDLEANIDNLPKKELVDGLISINGLFRHGWLLAPALLCSLFEEIDLKFSGLINEIYES